MAAERGATLLIQFARSPRVGQVKTRMLASLSARQACELHCELMRWTCSRLTGSALGPVQLSVAGALNHPVVTECAAMGVSGVEAQRGADLGERMYEALSCALENFVKVVLVGSDCPAIDGDYLGLAVAGLDRAPVVLGPALDGGYVLIGVRQVEAGMFRDISWGTETVYSETLSRLRELGLDWLELPPLGDIDRPEDLPAWHRLRDQLAGA